MARNRRRGVGYKNPPVHAQFKKGFSGNPKGRPKGSVNIIDTIYKVLHGVVNVTVQGRRKKMTKIEAVLTQAANQAMAGSPQATRIVLDAHRFADQSAGENAKNRPITVILSGDDAKL
jgi:hypothetical protein